MCTDRSDVVVTGVAIAVGVAFLALVLVAGAGGALGRLIAPHASAVVLGSSVLAVGVVAGMLLLVAPLGETAVRVASIVAVVAAMGVLVLGVRDGGIGHAIPVIAAALGSTVFAVGLFGRTITSDRPFTAAAERFLPLKLPVDNEIPALLATWFGTQNAPPNLVGDWLPSDRPPLQSGIILLTRGVTWPIASAGVPPAQIDIAASIVAQSLWVPGAIALVVAIGLGRASAIAAASFAALVPVMFLNTVFTWPKLLAGGFVVAAIAVLVSGIRGASPRPLSLVLAAALATMGALSHGGAAFLLPLVAALAIILLTRMTNWRERGAAAGAAAGTVVVAYLPWFLFQRFVAPPGDRLLKWHLAGVVPIDDRSFLTALVEQYTALTFPQFVQARLSNLSHAFDLRLLDGLDVWVPGAIDRRLMSEFFETPIALAWGIVPVGALLVICAIRIVRRRPIESATGWSAVVTGGAIACIAIWALVMFAPGAAVVHQGSHGWIIILLVVPFAWLARSRWWAAAVLAVAQTVSSIALVRTSPLHPEAGLDPYITAVGLVVLVAAVGYAYFSPWPGGSRHPSAFDAPADGGGSKEVRPTVDTDRVAQTTSA